MLSVISERICNLFDYIHDNGLKIHCKMNSSDFTRNSPLNFVNLVLILLFKGDKSNTLELTCFFGKIGNIEPTKETLSQARLKLKPVVFKKLKKYYLSMIYKDFIKG